jgi:hypothetical protein
MKAILIETILVIEAIVFWAVALPAAFVFFKAAALWERIEASMLQGSIVPVGRRLALPRR